jgi:D-tyrosyl-tRNA(Tyr) deacylase
VIQRVKSCEVSVGGETVSEIGTGLLVLLGIARGDGEAELSFMAEKILNLRIFPDGEDRMNLSVLETGGELMVVSQFTLLADCRKGRRPSFVDAEAPDIAEPLYERFAARLAESGLKVATGAFGAMMNVSLDNWGPVTLVIDAPSSGPPP